MVKGAHEVDFPIRVAENHRVCPDQWVMVDTYRRVPFFWQKSSDKVELRSCWSHVDGMQSKPHTLPSTNHRSAVFELISP